MNVFSSCIQLTTGRSVDEIGDFYRLPRQHVYLALDPVLHDIPWESTPTLRSQSVSRIPSYSYLQRSRSQPLVRRGIDPKKTFFIINPTGDMPKTEKSLLPVLQRCGFFGINGSVGRENCSPKSLLSHDCYLYMGHNAGGALIPPKCLRELGTLPTGCAVVLMGCSSCFADGASENFLVAGCPSFTGCLWDVADGDIDRFTRCLLETTNAERDEVRPVDASDMMSKLSFDDRMTVPEAIAVARSACKLRHLTGSAVVTYGIPIGFQFAQH